MSSGESSQAISELLTSEENSREEILPSKIFGCQFPNSDNQEETEYYFETDHVSRKCQHVESIEISLECARP